jgi:hypothetical protein
MNDINPMILSQLKSLKVHQQRWGYRASNGVVLITTKKVRGKISVDISSSVSLIK